MHLNVPPMFVGCVAVFSRYHRLFRISGHPGFFGCAVFLDMMICPKFRVPSILFDVLFCLVIWLSLCAFIRLQICSRWLRMCRMSRMFRKCRMCRMSRMRGRWLRMWSRWLWMCRMSRMCSMSRMCKTSRMCGRWICSQWLRMCRMSWMCRMCDGWFRMRNRWLQMYSLWLPMCRFVFWMSWLFRHVLFAIWCLLFAVCYLLFAICCLLFACCCLLSAACCLLFAICAFTWLWICAFVSIRMCGRDSECAVESTNVLPAGVAERGPGRCPGPGEP